LFQSKEFDQMQNPNEDTEWNDILRAKGILPPKEDKQQEQQPPSPPPPTIQHRYQDTPFNQLDDFQDEEDDEVFAKYKRERLKELKEKERNDKFGELREISAQDYIKEVNNAGLGVWVVVHLSQDSLPLSNLVNQRLKELAKKFPQTKFLKIRSTDCIKNYPDRNLPTILIYFEDELKQQLIGIYSLGGPELTLNG